MSQDKSAPSPTGNILTMKRIRVPELISIPSCEFWMGTSEEQVYELLAKEDWAHEWYDNDLFMVEQPYHLLSMPEFAIAQKPVTNFEYFQFVWNSGYRAPRGWKGLHFADGEGDHPVVGVSREDALAFVAWLNKELKAKYRLPSEAEWELASRGTDGRIYPWGNEFDPWRCNTSESGKRGTTPVGSYSPSGDSPYGVMDVVGNVWEWTSSTLSPYPYESGDGREELKVKAKCVGRGGSWYYSRKLARCAAREGVLDNFVSPALGFRVAHDAITPPRAGG